MRFIPPAFGQSSGGSKKTSASDAFKQAQKGGKASAGGERPSYEDILQTKMQEMRDEALKGSKYSFNLLGTDASGCRELSKSAQEMIQKVAEKKAKQAAKKASKADIVAVQAKYFVGQQGGRVDKQGRIFDAAGKEVMSIDKKTGKIKNKMGNTVGKYDPNSPMSEHKICQLISKYSTQPASQGSIWGAPSGGAQGGNVWGSGGGNIWGNNNSDDKGWW